MFYILQRWCLCYFKPGFHIGVTTNNGIEALNNSLKQFYLKLVGSGSLASLVDTLVTDFVPEQVMTYTRLNYTFSSQYKRYHDTVPAYLHNMPRTVVKHCMSKIAASADYQKEDIVTVSDGVYRVKSETSPNIHYTVDLGTIDRSPSCNCLSFTSSYLPCKHMFAVFRETDSTWNDLSAIYRTSPYMTLDVEFLSEGAVSPLGIDDHDDGQTINPPVLLCSDVNEQESPLCDTQNLETTRKNLRGNLKLLHDLSFIGNDADILTEVNDVIVGLVDIVKGTADTFAEGNK